MGVDEAKAALREAIAFVIELNVLRQSGMLRLTSPEPLFGEHLDGLVESYHTAELGTLLAALYGRLTKLHEAVGGTRGEIDSLALLVDWRIPTHGSGEVH